MVRRKLIIDELKTKIMTKKYFMAGTDDELKYGDIIEISLVGEEEGVKKHTHLECKFMPEIVDDLLEEEIIEEREVEDDLIDFGDDDLSDFREAVAADIEELNQNYASLDSRVEKLEALICEVRGIKPKKETASSKKK